MLKVKKGDIVQVIKGKDRDKKGKVLQIFLEKKRALVEGVNLIKKHKRQTRQDQQGGIVSLESPVCLSNLMFFCKRCNRPVRIGFNFSKDGTKSRFCKSCKEVI